MIRSLATLLAIAACLVAQPASAGDRTLRAGGRDRTYLVHRPATLGAGQAAPLVIVLHGGYGTGADAEERYGWDQSADAHGFVAVFPNGFERSWNAGECCGPAHKQSIDDVGFLNALISRLTADEAIDPKRIYIAGMSNGAAMTYRYACEGSAPIAAIGIVAGALTLPCLAPQKLSLIIFHGTADEHIPMAGGVGPKGHVAVDWPPFRKTLDLFQSAEGCGPSTSANQPPLSISKASCADNRAMTVILIAGAGHQWPGSKARRGIVANLLGMDPPSQAMDATAALTDFFLAHPR